MKQIVTTRLNRPAAAQLRDECLELAELLNDALTGDYHAVRRVADRFTYGDGHTGAAAYVLTDGEDESEVRLG